MAVAMPELRQNSSRFSNLRISFAFKRRKGDNHPWQPASFDAQPAIESFLKIARILTDEGSHTRAVHSRNPFALKQATLRQLENNAQLVCQMLVPTRRPPRFSYPSSYP